MSNYLPMIERHVERMHERRIKSTAELHRMIRDAVAAGHSMAAVGKAAGLTRQRVHQILNEKEA